MEASAAGSMQASGGGGVKSLGTIRIPHCFINVLLDDDHLTSISAFVEEKRESAYKMYDSKDSTKRDAAEVMDFLEDLAFSLSDKQADLFWSPVKDCKLVWACRFLGESGSVYEIDKKDPVINALDVVREKTAKGVLRKAPEQLITDGFDPLWVALSREFGKCKLEGKDDHSGASGEIISKLRSRALQRALDDYWLGSDLHGFQLAADPECTDVEHDLPKDPKDSVTTAKPTLYTCATALLSLERDLASRRATRSLSGTMDDLRIHDEPPSEAQLREAEKRSFAASAVKEAFFNILQQARCAKEALSGRTRDALRSERNLEDGRRGDDVSAPIDDQRVAETLSKLPFSEDVKSWLKEENNALKLMSGELFNRSKDPNALWESNSAVFSQMETDIRSMCESAMPWELRKAEAALVSLKTGIYEPPLSSDHLSRMWEEVVKGDGRESGGL